MDERETGLTSAQKEMAKVLGGILARDWERAERERTHPQSEVREQFKMEREP